MDLLSLYRIIFFCNVTDSFLIGQAIDCNLSGENRFAHDIFQCID